MATQSQVYDALLAQYGPKVAKAFEAAIDDLRAQADLARLIDAIARNDIAEAIAALHLDPAAYNQLVDAVEAAYRDGGQQMADALPSPPPGHPANALVFRFNARNPRAETWLGQYSSTLVTRITDEQVEVVRTVLERGMSEGQAPRDAALDIVGRINRLTGKREGGVLGLSAPQEAYVASARQELADLDSHYFTRTLRDKRFDSTVRKAIDSGKPIPDAVRAKIVTAYEGRLLKLRGQTIGRTEAMTSLQQAKLEGARQLVDSGKATETQVRRVWRNSGLRNSRDSHVALNGETVGLNEAWISPVSGAAIMYPGDPQAPAGERINCACDQAIRVDWFSNLR